jgi:hypothetical protein
MSASGAGAKRRRGSSGVIGDAGSDGGGDFSKRTPSVREFTLSPLRQSPFPAEHLPAQSPFPEILDSYDRYGSLRPQTPGDWSAEPWSKRKTATSESSMRPPTPRGAAVGEGFRPATPQVAVSPMVEVPGSSPRRTWSASRGPSVLTSLPPRSPAPLPEISPRVLGSSLDSSAFFESPDKVQSALEKEALEMSHTSALNQSRMYHLEESLVMAKSRSDRYEQELTAEMARSSALASKVARLEETNSVLKEDLRASQAKVATQASVISEYAARQKTKKQEEDENAHTEEATAAKQAAAAHKEELYSAQTALLHAQRDLDLAKAECSHLQERLALQQSQAAQRCAQDPLLPGMFAFSALCSIQECMARPTAGEVICVCVCCVSVCGFAGDGAPARASEGQGERDAGDFEAKVRSLEITLKHQREELERLRSEASKVPELETKAQALARAQVNPKP